MTIPKGFEIVEEEIEQPQNKFKIPKGFEFVEDEKQISKETPFERRRKQTIRERKELTEFGASQPTSIKLVQLSEGLGNLAQQLSGGMPTEEQILKRTFGLPGESPEEREMREKREGAGEFLGSALIPFPGFEQKVESFLNKLIPQRATTIENIALAGKEPPISTFKTAKDILSELKQSESIPRTQPIKEPILPSQQPIKGKQLAGRVTKSQSDLGIRPTTQKGFPSSRSRFKDQILDKVHPNEFYNKTRAGTSIKDEIAALDRADYKKVNKLYETSRELNKGISQVHPELAEQITSRLTELEKIPEPSTVQKTLIRALKNISKDLVETTPEGELIGYKPINNQTLIDQVQSLRQIVDYDFEHAVPKNIFKPLIKDIVDAANNAAKSTNPKAYESLQKANKAYSEWSRTFNNDYINPYRDLSNKDFIKLFDKATDIDNYNVLKDVLSKSDKGRELLNATKRSLVEKNLSSHFKDPRKGFLEFDKQIRELEAVLTKEEATQIKQSFEKYRQPSRLVGKQISKAPQQLKVEKAISKYTNTTPENIEKMMNTRTGIKNLKSDLSKSERGKELFDKLATQKVRDIIRQDQVKPTYTGEELYKVINKKSNYELLSELLSEEEAAKMLDLAQNLSKKGVTRKTLLRVAKYYSKYKFLKILMGIL